MPDFTHRSVLVAEVLAALQPRPAGRYVDGTLGGGGHAAAILAASSPTGWLYGCDRDSAAVEAASRRLAGFAGRFELRQASFAELARWVPTGSCDGVLLDLGPSSPQLDRAERGFSFQQEGPLDMRMDTRQGNTAADLVNSAGSEELSKLFWELGGERQARRLARAIVERRTGRPFETTRSLAALIEQVAPRRGGKTHPATKVFQALRIAVNDEIGALQQGLDAALKVLKSGGRLAVITFHSLEDRTAKEFGRTQARNYTFAGPQDVPELRQPRAPALKVLTLKALKPGAAELADNPRSRSAQLRVMEKI
ncbi:MAG: 16S rRNA (cytosine(1402)-N(4))-methyltransferase RsmH [Limisphaerales bacterium]